LNETLIAPIATFAAPRNPLPLIVRPVLLPAEDGTIEVMIGAG